ncbi:unnamed protein product [Adineta ricciae]|uniref:Homeobox domain-containing protein n=1 Tax=Adineta ricciae TaxID=249248 RepID=A0A813QYN1_ADIRI|nr:unnamed protein product [Adineta ricciae]
MEPTVDRSIHFLIPALSSGKATQVTTFTPSLSLLDEPSHILSLPETFSIQRSPLEIPLSSGKYILAPSPSELFHYYESVQPQMNHIISSSEGLIDHLTSENFIHIVENLSEYSIPCPVLQSHVDKSTSMLSIDEFDEIVSTQPIAEYNIRPSPSFYDSTGEYSSTPLDDPNLFLHNNEQSALYLNQSNRDIDYQWTALPVSITSNEYNSHWKKVRPNGKFLNNKAKGRHSRKRTKFSNDDLEILNLFFEKNPMPSRSDISILSEKLAYPRYIVQVWFYNKRQSLKRANSSSLCQLNRISN